MKVIDPFRNPTYLGARAYSSNIDVPLYERAKDIGKEAEFKRDIEREWKVLLLTKNFVVTGASAMISEFGYQFFRDNPILLEENLILPAVGNHVIGSDWENGGSVDDLVAYYSKRLPSTVNVSKHDFEQFFRQNIGVGVGWDISSNTGLFKSKFLYGLQNEGTVLRQNLHRLSKNQLRELARFFENQSDNFSRKTVEEGVRLVKLSPNEAEAIFKFQELMYNMSGASVVNGESCLPQENQLYDYSIADIVGRKIILSEKDIFFKIFFELYFESILQATAIPPRALDFLSFEDVLSMRRSFQDSQFVTSYNQVIEKTSKAVEQGDMGDFFDLQQLYLIRTTIEERYQKSFEFARKKAEKEGLYNELTQHNVGLGIGLSSFFQVSTLAGGAEVPHSYMFGSASNYTQSRAIMDEKERYKVLQNELLKSRFLANLSATSQNEIIEFANELYRRVESNLNNQLRF